MLDLAALLCQFVESMPVMRIVCCAMFNFNAPSQFTDTTSGD